MLRLMGAEPEPIVETPTLQKILDWQRRTESLVVSLQCQVSCLQEELGRTREALEETRKEAENDRWGYEGVIDSLLSLPRRRRDRAASSRPAKKLCKRK